LASWVQSLRYSGSESIPFDANFLLSSEATIVESFPHSTHTPKTFDAVLSLGRSCECCAAYSILEFQKRPRHVLLDDVRFKVVAVELVFNRGFLVPQKDTAHHFLLSLGRFRRLSRFEFCHLRLCILSETSRLYLNVSHITGA